jgi:hypothetical protein
MENKDLYRGKRKDNGEWVIGGLLKRPSKNWYFIGAIDSVDGDIVRTTGYLVDPATVGQCSGVPDKNGKLIFVGDYINYFGLYKTETWYKITDIIKDYEILKDRECVTVVGNIHDNTDLIPQ